MEVGAAILARERVDVVVGAVELELRDSLHLEIGVRILRVEDGDAHARVSPQIPTLRTPVGRVEDHMLPVRVDPDDARLRSAVGLEGRDDGEAPAAHERDLGICERRHAYLTVVGMFLIFPAASCCLIAATFAAIPFGAFGENLPMPTPLTFRPYTASLPPLKRPVFASRIASYTAVSTRFNADVRT